MYKAKGGITISKRSSYGESMCQKDKSQWTPFQCKHIALEHDLRIELTSA